jgi:hypothetical protein
MARHVAQVTLLESFDLGKNTARNAGVEIKVFDKGSAGKRGPQLGTIRIGQGSFAWWAKGAKTETKKGKRSPTLKLNWAEFADLMTSYAPKPNTSTIDQPHRQPSNQRAIIVPPKGNSPTTQNADASAFLEEQRAKAHFDEKRKTLKYLVGSRIAWRVKIQRHHAAVWQYRRFSGDLEFWRQRLSTPAEEKERRRALSFRLESRPDFDNFLDALTGASAFEWQNKPRRPRRGKPT